MKMTFPVFLAFFMIIHTVSCAGAATVEYDLDIAWQEISINSKTARGMTINGKIPGPTLRFREGDLARIRVHNSMAVATSIHWHGILVPPGMDGVPMITQPAIAPGETFTYEIPIRQSGTYWYHSHSALQEQLGLYGSIVISPATEQIRADRDQVVLLSDWTTDSPEYVLQTLKRGSEWYALEKGSAQSILGAVKADRIGDYYRRELQRMPPMDLADVAYDYFLANGKPIESMEAMAGERIRLRIINGSATTFFHLEFSGGPMTIVSSDGQEVDPVDSQRFLIGVAETYDVLVTVPGPGAYELRASSHDGSSWTSVWLGSGAKHPAPVVPRPDVYQTMHHGSVSSLFALTPAGTMGMPDRLVAEGRFDKQGMAGMHDMGSGAMETMSGHDDMTEMAEHGGMEARGREMELSGATMTMAKRPEAPTPEMPGEMAGKAMSMSAEMSPDTEPRDEAAPGGRDYGNRFGLLAADTGSRGTLAQEGSELRPLTPYAQLRAAAPTSLPAGKEIREFRLTLDGDMERYVWLLNNKTLSETDHILIREGEVVRFIMINRTMMHHPMHLHGHFFRILNGQGERSPLKHTVDVAPMSTTVIEFYTDEPGDWFFHCHLLYHMKSGMARLVHYQDFQPTAEVLGVRPALYRDSWYFHGKAEALSNMTEGVLNLANTRIMLKASWQVGWEKVEEEEWEGIASAGWYLNRFTSFFLGGRSAGVRSEESETVAILGLSYLLPLNIWATGWLDSEGELRLILAKEFELTPRIAIHAETEYDSLDGWEGAIGLNYMLNRHLSLASKWHSAYGFGVGLQGSF